MSKPSAILDKPASVTAAPHETAHGSRRAGVTDRRTIARAAIVVAWILVVTATTLSLIAALVHRQGIGLGLPGANASGTLELLTIAALALLGAIAASVAAVNQQPKRSSGWISLTASGAGLVALLLATLPLR